MHLLSGAFDSEGDLLAQLRDAPVVLTDEEIDVLQEKVDSVNQRDKAQGKQGAPLTLLEAVHMAQAFHLRCSATGVRGVLRRGALLQLSIDAVDSTRAHSAGNVQLMLTYLNYGKNRTPDAAYIYIYSACIYIYIYNIYIYIAKGPIAWKPAPPA